MHKSHALDFLDLGRFTLAFAQVIQFRAADLTTADNVYMIHTGGIDRESTFHANAIGYTAYSKRFADASVALCDNCAFKSLQACHPGFSA